MHDRLLILAMATFCGAITASAQTGSSCSDLASLKIDDVEITSSTEVPANAPIPSSYPHYAGSLPAHCRVEGMMHRREGVDGIEYGIGFAMALPEKAAWNGEFMMQGGGGGNGVVNYPVGASYSGDKTALARGFVVASTDTGHKARTGVFDFSFVRDQQAYLDFAYQANAEWPVWRSR
jgi:Tannase and feruloyl esterase